MVTKIFELWNRFWFQPISPSSVCIFRILFGLLALLQASYWLPDFLNWFGSNGILSTETIKRFESSPHLNVFLYLPENDITIIAVLALYIVAILCVIVGFKTRLSTSIVWLLMTSFHFRNPAYWFSADTPLRLYAFLLIFAPAGARFSLDAYFSKKSFNQSEQLFAPWAQRLIQFQVSAIYFQAFWGKLCGYEWWDGTAVYYALHRHFGDWLRYPLPCVLDHIWTINLLTWGALVIELSLWSIIWIKECRYWVLLAGIVFHSILNWCLNIDSLESAIMIGYINFVYPQDLERVLRYARSKLGFAL